MGWFSGIGHAIGSGVSSFDHLATKLDPLTHFNSWLTANTLGQIPGIGSTLDNWQGKVANHPVESFGTLAALYAGGEALGGAGGGAAAAGDAGVAGAGAADAGAVGAGAAGAGAGAGAGLGSLGTASGFGGVGVDAGATGFGAWGAGAGGADVGGLASLDSAAVGAEGASPGLTAGYGPASTGFNWQGMARQALSNGLKGQGSGGGSQWQPMQQNQDMGNAPQQRMAMALMQPSGGSGPYLPASQLGNAALAAYLMPQSNNQLLYQPGNVPTANSGSNRNQDGTAPLGSYY